MYILWRPEKNDMDTNISSNKQPFLLDFSRQSAKNSNSKLTDK